MAFSPNGHILASAGLSRSANLQLWDATTGRLLTTLDGHADQVRSLAFSPDGTRLASAGSDRTIRLWDAVTGNSLSTFSGHTNQVRSLAFSRDGRTLASASIDRTVRLWDVDTGHVSQVLPSGRKLAAIAFAPKGHTLAAADEGGDIIFASSAESVGAFWRWKLTEVVHESQFCDLRGPKTVRLSRHQFHLVVETFNGSRRNLSSSPEPIED